MTVGRQFKPKFVACDECGEYFYMQSAEHAYKLKDPEYGIVRFCSWSCLQAYDKKLEAKRKRKRYETRRGI